ncbi:MAG: response regulator [Candidatus Thermochlorobacter sp.]
MIQRPAKLKIVFVDDEPMILEGLSQLFDMMYDVQTFSNGQDAINYVREHPEVAIVVSDQRMPGLKGIDVLKAIKDISPDTIRMLLTGFADADAILDSVNVGEVFRYVKKPWNPEELVALMSLAATTHLERKKARAAKAAAAALASPPPPVPESFSLQQAALSELKKQQSVEAQFLNKLAQSSGNQIERAFHSASGKPKILVVDDEQGVLTALSQLLSDTYEVLTAKSADEALAMLKQDSFMTLLLTDQRMPKKTGTDFLIESRELAPMVPKILITAYTDVEDIIRLINEGQIYRYVQKPWNPEKLRELISEAVELYLHQVKAKLGEDGTAASTAEHDHNNSNAQHTTTNQTLSALAALSKMAKEKSST